MIYITYHFVSIYFFCFLSRSHTHDTRTINWAFVYIHSCVSRTKTNKLKAKDKQKEQQHIILCPSLQHYLINASYGRWRKSTSQERYNIMICSWCQSNIRSTERTITISLLLAYKHYNLLSHNFWPTLISSLCLLSCSIMKEIL